MLEPVMFTGGLYKHDLVLELVEDLGGYILQKNVTQTEIILLLLVPSEDMNALEILSRDLRGELVRAPLVEQRWRWSHPPWPFIICPMWPAILPSICAGMAPRPI